MTDANSEVSVTVEGRRYIGWTGVSISAGVERAARDFRVDLTLEPGGAAPAFASAVAAGDRVEVCIGSDLVMTGYVDALPISYDDTSVTRSMSGRSLTADLVDCAALGKGGQWLGASVGRIARDLAAPYGVTVVDDAVSLAPIADHQIDPGESAFESLDRLLELRRLLAFDDGKGRLVLSGLGTKRCITALVYGENIKSCDASRDFKEVYSEYRVLAQRAGDDFDFAETTNQMRAVVKDSRVRRRRVLQVMQSGQATLASCRDLAVFERDRRAARPYEVSYTVQGWRQGDGRLWQPNERVLVFDEVLGLSGAEMLIAEVEYSYGEAGTIAVLRVGPPAAYMQEPAAPPRRGRKATGIEATP